MPIVLDRLKRAKNACADMKESLNKLNALILARKINVEWDLGTQGREVRLDVKLMQKDDDSREFKWIVNKVSDFKEKQKLRITTGVYHESGNKILTIELRVKPSFLRFRKGLQLPLSNLQRARKFVNMLADTLKDYAESAREDVSDVEYGDSPEEENGTGNERAQIEARRWEKFVEKHGHLYPRDGGLEI